MKISQREKRVHLGAALGQQVRGLSLAGELQVGRQCRKGKQRK